MKLERHLKWKENGVQSLPGTGMNPVVDCAVSHKLNWCIDVVIMTNYDCIE